MSRAGGDEDFALPASFPRTFSDYVELQPPHELNSFLPGFQLGRNLERIDAVGDERPLVLVTGCTGFIGSHVALQLVFLGYRVRCAVRKKESKWSQWLLGLNRREGLAKAIEVCRERIKSEIPKNPGTVELVECTLGVEKNWDQAVIGVDSMIHCAQRTRETALEKTKLETESMFADSLKGLLCILQNCKRAGVRRVVYVSSMVAMDEDALSKPPVSNVPVMCCDDSTWTPAKTARKRNMHPYILAKVFIETAFWRFVREFDDTFEAVVIAPGMTLGPTVNGRIVSSYDPLLFFSVFNCPTPPIEVEVVDVRNAAFCMISAIQKPASLVHGKRYMLCTASKSALSMTQFLYEWCHRNGVPQYASEYAINHMPKAIAALANPIVPDFREGVWTQWESKRYFSNLKSVLDLGCQYLNAQDMLSDTLENLIYFDIFPQPKNRFLPPPYILGLGAAALSIGAVLKSVSDPYIQVAYLLFVVFLGLWANL